MAEPGLEARVAPKLAVWCWLCFLLCAQPVQCLRVHGHSAADAQVGTSDQPRAFVHFLFLVNDTLPHHEIWRSFFAAAPEGSWAAWVHCADEACGRHPSLAAFPLKIVPRVFSKWGVDLVTPEVSLLRAAMDRTPSASAPALEKFVMMSDTTLPLKPYEKVAEALSDSPNSNFCMLNPTLWPQGTIRKQRYVLPKHQQWVVLNRSDASNLVQRWGGPLISKWGWTATLPDGSPVPRIEFEAKGEMAEENVYSIVQGALALRTTGDAEMGKFRGEHSSCRTYLATMLDIRKVVLGTPAVAKFSPYANVTWQMLRDKETEFHDQVPVELRPIVYTHVGRQFMEALRSSPFLFARKFPGEVPSDWAEYFFGSAAPRQL